MIHLDRPLLPVKTCFYSNSSTVVPVNFKLNMHRQEGLSIEVVLEKISQIPNPQVVLWYIGSHGLKKEGVDFYKSLMNNILSFPNNSSCWLLDLTAWSSLFNPKIKITQINKCGQMLNDFKLNRIHCIFSSLFFDGLKKIQDPEVIEHFKTHIFTKSSLRQSSEAFKESRITIGQIFNHTCPVLESLYEEDTSKSYSLLQYLEGCFLINEVIKKCHESEGDINIVFSLPNDEAKYYFSEEESFIKDCKFLMEKEFGEKLGQREINIHFLNFEYGNEARNRPYNAGKRVLKKINPQDVI